MSTWRRVTVAWPEPHHGSGGGGHYHPAGAVAIDLSEWIDRSEDASGATVADDGTLGIVPFWGGFQQGPLNPDADETDPFCTDHAGDVHHIPEHPNLTYKTFIDHHPVPAVTRALLADRYDPPAAGTYPAVVMVHGGAWWRGCRWLFDDFAYNASRDTAGVGTKFIAFSIEHRLACTYGDTRTQMTPLEFLCGWTYQSIDPDTGTSSNAIRDVQDAVRWAKAHANDYCGGSQICWDGSKVYLLGGSSGGNLSLAAAARSTLDGAPNNRPTAVALWSGAPRLTPMNTFLGPLYGCTNVPGPGGYKATNNSTGCWNVVNQYLGCGNPPTDGPDPNCEQSGIYSAASPYTYYSVAPANSLPPPFFANGGGPTAGVSNPELIALGESDDLRNALLPTWSASKFQECTVNTTLHGSAYVNDPAKTCNEYHSGEFTVWKSTITWLLTQT